MYLETFEITIFYFTKKEHDIPIVFLLLFKYAIRLARGFTLSKIQLTV